MSEPRADQETKAKKEAWKVHIFSDSLLDELMRRVNSWFEENPKAEVQMILQSSAPHIQKDGNSTIIVTISIFYT